MNGDTLGARQELEETRRIMENEVWRQRWCNENNWKIVFFEGAGGAPRTGIVDAVMIRIKPSKSDSIEVRLVQLKAGVAGLKAAEVARLKNAVTTLSTDWPLAPHDGATLHLVPDVPKRGNTAALSGQTQRRRP
jgi:hypothetical protein